MNTNPSTSLQTTNTRLSGIGRKKYDRNQVIFREHENGDMAYIIADGQVQIVKESDNGPTVLGVLETGAMFGEMALIDDKPRMASAKAINGPVELLIVSKANFQKKMEKVETETKALKELKINPAIFGGKKTEQKEDT